MKETAEGQTHYCRACELTARGAATVPQHTCGIPITQSNLQELGSGTEELPTELQKSPTLPTIIKEAQDTFIHFIMGVHGFTKQNEPEATQKCIDEAVAWFNTFITTAYNSRQSEIDAAREEERERGARVVYLILPLAKGYVAQNPHVSSKRYIEIAEEYEKYYGILSATKTPEHD